MLKSSQSLHDCRPVSPSTEATERSLAAAAQERTEQEKFENMLRTWDTKRHKAVLGKNGYFWVPLSTGEWKETMIQAKDWQDKTCPFCYRAPSSEPEESL